MSTSNKDFSKATIKQLAARGITIVSTTWLPGTDGSFTNGERGYILNDNGTQRIRTWTQVNAV